MKVDFITSKLMQTSLRLKQKRNYPPFFHADSGIILLIGQLAEPLVPETFMNMTQMVIQNSLEALEQMTAIAQEKK